MTQRGRGLLEVKPSENPFFQTSNTDIGVNPQEKIKWKVEGHVPHFHASSNHKVDGNFSFLYTRTSDDIGSKVRKPLERKDGVLTKTEFLKKKREEYHSTMTEEEIGLESAPKSPTKVKPEDILKVYKHNSKNEDPRYTTSTNEYGKKPPSVATLVVDRAARPQGFSKSFQNIKPQNTSLNTALTKSTVHKTLDPQFA